MRCFNANDIKYLAFFLAVFILPVICGCGGGDASGDQTDTEIVAIECNAGVDISCVDNFTYRVCSDAGKWGVPIQCASGQICSNGACIIQGNQFACTAGQEMCVAHLIKTCSPLGTWNPETACPEGQTCI